MENTNQGAPQSGEAPNKMEPENTDPRKQAPTEGDVQPGGGDPALKGYDPENGPGPCPPNIQEPFIKNATKRADLPWQVIQLAESLPNDVTLVGYFMLGADHVLVTDKGFFGLHEGSLSPLKVHVVVDND